MPQPEGCLKTLDSATERHKTIALDDEAIQCFQDDFIYCRKLPALTQTLPENLNHQTIEQFFVIPSWWKLDSSFRHISNRILDISNRADDIPMKNERNPDRIIFYNTGLTIYTNSLVTAGTKIHWGADAVATRGIVHHPVIAATIWLKGESVTCSWAEVTAAMTYRQLTWHYMT